MVIENKGILLVTPISRNFLALNVLGDFTLRGTIVYRRCVATAGGRSTSFPDGTTTSFTHLQQALGGDGGTGGIESGRYQASPGVGAPGSKTYGGGGGGSGISHPQVTQAGDDGNTYRPGTRYKPAGRGGRVFAS